MEQEFFFSPSTMGFYSSDIHESMPEDVVGITAALWEELLDGQSAGKFIMPPDQEHELPWLSEPPTPTPEEQAAEALHSAHAAIRDARRAAEYGGVMVHGLLFPTDQKSELRLSGLERKFAADPAHVEPWLVGETWIYMHAALFAEYADAFAAHVASCFAVEKGKHEALNAAGCETAGEAEEWLAANLRSGWPGMPRQTR